MCGISPEYHREIINNYFNQRSSNKNVLAKPRIQSKANEFD